MKRIAAIFLAVMLALSGFTVPVSAKSDRLGEFEHSDKKFTDFEYKHIDVDEIYKKIDEMLELCGDSANTSRIEVIIGEIDDIATLFYDMTFYSTYQFTKNSTDEYWKEEYLYCSGSYTNMVSRFLESLKVVYDSPCADAVKNYFSEEDVEYIINAEIPDPEAVACRIKHEELLAEYYAINPEVQYMGKTYTAESFVEAYYAGELSDIAVAMIYPKLLKQLRADAGDIYFRMIENNTKHAKIAGFDNYMDYVYKYGFERDYTPEDAKIIWDTVREKLSPYQKYFGAYNNAYLQNKAGEIVSEGIINVLGKFIGRMGPEFQESYDYMVKTEGCVIVPQGTSQTSFTSSLTDFGMPFICMTESADDLWEFGTLIHEFGHYNSMYWRDISVDRMVGMDLEEIYSLGMEFLFSKYYEEIYEDAGKSAEMEHLGSMINSYIYSSACMAETEYVAYTGNFKTVEELMDALDKVYYKYYSSGEPDWIQFPHLYQSPGYCISYVVSGLNALEIYEISLEDYDKALDMYIDLIKYVHDNYPEAVIKAGFTDKWTAESLAEFFDKLMALYMDTEAPVIYGAEEGGTYTGTADIRITDTSGLSLILTKNGKNIYPTSRYFAVAGADDPYTLTVQDGFGNVTQIGFTVEPVPFAINAEAENKKNVLTWDAVDKAEYYKVYGAVLGKGYRLLGTVDDTDRNFTDKVKGTKTYKYYVEACATNSRGEEVILGKSLKCYVVGAKNTKRSGTDSIDIEGAEIINLSSGEKTRIITVRTLKEADEADIAAGSIKGVRYVSTNTGVAKVSKKGKITAVGKGTCYIYAISENGKMDRVMVKVS